MAGLPPRGALHRAQDPKGWAWGAPEELAAQTVEAIDAVYRQLHASATKPGTPQPKPHRIPRPQRDETDRPIARRRKASLVEIGRFLTGG